jgi:hypothetical protein
MEQLLQRINKLSIIYINRFMTIVIAKIKHFRDLFEEGFKLIFGFLEREFGNSFKGFLHKLHSSNVIETAFDVGAFILIAK